MLKRKAPDQRRAYSHGGGGETVAAGSQHLQLHDEFLISMQFGQVPGSCAHGPRSCARC
jgi:hypothetical protein